MKMYPSFNLLLVL